MPKKMKKDGEPEVHDDLKGFDIKISPFGEITSNIEVDKLNDFLDDNVKDKKLKHLDSSEEE